MKRRSIITLIIGTAFLLTSCYSIFSGGTGGRVVDAESTAAPKAGISDVEVFAYTDQSARDTDFSSWDGFSHFTPRADYYARTTTGSDGTFSFSKIMWKENKPDFGKDGDVASIYLLFYHQNYGLEKGGTLIVSDSSSDTVYQEMTKIRKSTVINFSVTDVATEAAGNQPVLVTVTVPQTSQTNINVAPLKEKAVITGNGAITVTYPRWQSYDDRNNGIETEPTVQIRYEISGDEKTWAACYNGDNDEKDYAFMETPVVSKKISGDTYSIHLYGKSSKLRVPVISGTFGDTSLSENDGITIKMTGVTGGEGESGAVLDLGQVTTVSQTVGTSSSQTHGNFSGLGSNMFWYDNDYKDKYATLSVTVSGGSGDKTRTVTKVLRSDNNSDSVKL